MKPLSTTEAAGRLGVSARRIRDYIEKGIRTPSGKVKLAAMLIANRYIINSQDLEKFKNMREKIKN